MFDLITIPFNFKKKYLQLYEFDFGPQLSKANDFFDIVFAYCSKTSLDSNFHFEMTFINLEF